jgi:hypothetical protein
MYETFLGLRLVSERIEESGGGGGQRYGVGLEGPWIPLYEIIYKQSAPSVLIKDPATFLSQYFYNRMLTSLPLLLSELSLSSIQ